MNRNLVLGAGLIVGLGIAIYIAISSENSDIEDGPIATYAGCEFVVGDISVYDFKESVSSKTNPNAIISGKKVSKSGFEMAPLVKQESSGKLYVRVDQILPGRGAELSVAFDDFQQSENGAKVGRDLLTPWQQEISVFVGNDCAMQKIAFFDHEPQAQNNWLRLMQSFAFDDRNQPSWSAQMTDTTGTYTASFERTTQNDSVRIHKSDKRYIDVTPIVNDAAKLELSANVLFSELVVTKSGLGWLDSLTYMEKTEVSLLATNSLIGRVAVQRSLTRQTSGQTPRWPGLKSNNKPAWQKVATQARSRKNSKRTAVLSFSDDSDIANLSQEELLAKFNEYVSRANKDGKYFQKAAGILARYIMQDPSHAQEIMDLVASGEIPEEIQGMVFYAFEIAGGEAVHDVLNTVMLDNSFSNDNRVRAIAALADVHDPSDQVVDNMLAASSDDAMTDDIGALRNSTNLALGRLLGRDEVSQNSKDKLEKNLLTKLDRASGEQDIPVLLNSLGNTVNPDYAKHIEPYVRHDEMLVRANAIGALENTNAKQDATFWIDTIENEEHPTVLDAVSRRLETQDKDHVNDAEIERAANVLAITSDLHKRKALLSLLLSQVKTNRSARIAVINHFPNETNKDLIVLIGKHISAAELR